MSKEKISILFQPSGRRGEIESGKTVLAAAQELGVPIESLCGGKTTCGKCKVRLERIPLEKDGSGGLRLSPFSDEEERFIKGEERKAGFRLACAVRLYSDVLVFVPEESR